MSNTALQESWSEIQIREARNRLWKMGRLEWKLSGTQLILYHFYHDRKNHTIVVNASRRLGKSYFLITLALEQCIKFPGSTVQYIQPTKDMIKTNLNPDFERMIDDCPLEIRPVYKTAGNVWEFPNGSRIQLAGTDGKNYNKLRGGNPHLCLIDEAGFCSDLKHILDSIITPMTIKTRGRIVLSSTTPDDPNHEFIKQMETAETQDGLIRKTIYDAVEDDKNSANPQMTEEILAETLEKYKNRQQAFRTEFLCEVIFDSDNQVIPEFTQEVQDETIVPWIRPPHFDRYVSMDIGFVDMTVILFGYWHWDDQVLVIEDELVFKGQQVNADDISEMVRAKERELWRNEFSREMPDIYKRVSDNNYIFLGDLSRRGVHFIPTEKQDKDAYLGEVRLMVQARKIIIHPKCKTLINHMRGAQWDKNHKSFKRSPNGHHYDAVDALLYLVRNLNRSRNPYPPGYRYSQMGNKHEIFVDPNTGNEIDAQYKKIKDMFTRKSSFRVKNNK